jgi:hypothetical protein
MGLFSERKAQKAQAEQQQYEQQQYEQQQVVELEQLEADEAALDVIEKGSKDDFLAWVAELTAYQTKTNAEALSDGALRQVRPMPLPKTTALNGNMMIQLGAYSRTFTQGIVAQTRASSPTVNGKQFWQSVSDFAKATY